MSLFAIGDTHLSFSGEKPMNIFRGWDDYENKLRKNWNAIVTPEDTVVIAGDISWAMDIEEALEDFRYLDSLNGTKIILKGNHDYWWATKKKIEDFFKKNNISTIKILFNNAYRVGDIAICGTRGWFFDCAVDADKKVLLREAGRLQRSVDEAKQLGGRRIAFLHYPPLSRTQVCDEIYEVLKSSEVEACYYGHLHGQSAGWAVNSVYDGIDFHLVSADFLEFCPKLVEKF